MSTTTAAAAPAATNAWSKPLQSKSPPAATATATPSSSAPPPGTKAGENSNGDAVALRERYLQTLLLAVGTTVTLHLKDGGKLQGVFHTASPFRNLDGTRLASKYVLRAVNPIGTDRYELGSTAVVPMADVVSVHVKSLRLDGGGPPASGNSAAVAAAAAAGGGIAFTDTEISRPPASGGSAWTLQEAGAAWTGGGGAIGGALQTPPSSGGLRTNSRAAALAPPSGGSGAGPTSSAGPPGTTTVSGGLTGKIGNWDQFQANEKLFNVKGTYDENLYTTELDKSKFHRSQIRQAERIAKEIVSTEATNIHQAEERGQALQGDYTEEDLYSGVLLKSKLQISGTDEARQKADAAAGGPRPSSQQQPKAKMNYAAAAAKTAPPGFGSSDKKGGAETPTKSPPFEGGEVAAKKEAQDKAKKDNVKVPDEKKPTLPEEDKVAEDTAKAEPKEDKEKEKDRNESSLKVPSKLNAKAKEFTLNIHAKSFTPSFGSSSDQHQLPQPPQLVPQYQPYPIDPNTGMPFGMPPGGGAGGDPNMPGGQPHYMHPGQMGQPGTYLLDHSVRVGFRSGYSARF